MAPIAPLVTGPPVRWGRCVYRRGMATSIHKPVVFGLATMLASILLADRVSPVFVNIIMFSLIIVFFVRMAMARYVYDVTSLAGEQRTLSESVHRRSWQKSELGEVHIYDFRDQWQAKRWDGSILGYAIEPERRQLFGDSAELFIAPGLTSEQEWVVAHILSVGRQQERFRRGRS